MNPLSIIAFLMAFFILGFGIHSAGNTSAFLDEHAILIVLGGTIAAGSISFQVDRLGLLFKVFIKRVLFGKKQNYIALIEEIMGLSELYRTQSSELEKRVEACKDPFLKEAMGVLMEDLLDEVTLHRVLKKRVDTMFQRQTEEVFKFKTVGRFPPAFGLMGTTLSMITLLSKLGQPGGQKLIGPSMSLGLVATFHGLALSNMVFAPIAENLADGTKETKLKNSIIVEGIRLIIQKTNPVVLAEELNSFLLPSERIDWKKVTGANNGQQKAA